MTSLLTKFLRRVRIRGGEFDASARAMHREAALENVSRATIERKLMSTKTTLKRVSLVAVAALGLGLLSVVPSSATSQADTLTLTSATSSTTVGAAVTNTLTQAFTGLGGDTMTVTASVSSAPTGNSTVPTLTVNQASNTNASTSVAGLVGTTADTASATVYNSASGVYTVSLPTTALAGTYVIKFTAAVLSPNTGTVNASAITWTVTVANEAAATAADSTWGMASGTGTPSIGTHTAINTVKAVGTAQAASIQVTPQKPTTTLLTNPIKLTVTISGPGSLASATSLGALPISGTGRALTTATSGYFIGVYSDGTAGAATITISEPGGAVLATATVNFADTLASFTLTPTNTVTAVGQADSVTIAGKDAAGVTAPLGTYYLSSSNTAVATVGTSGTGSTFSVQGVGAGTAVITVANASSSPTVTKTYTITVGKATAKTVTLTTDKASYAAGEKITLTVTAVGSDGTATGDNATFVAFSNAGITSNVALQGMPSPVSSTVKLVGGVATYTLYAPLTEGTVTIYATEGTGIDHVATDSTTAAVLSTSFDVSNPSSAAAVDAANAATDAANYAADAADAATTAAQEATAAAQAAQDSADAATAAVVALGLRVDTLMASVRAQLTSLSNLLVRIIKKTKA